jgi:hypothetical protein
MRIRITKQHLKIFIIANVVSILVNFRLFDNISQGLISIVGGLIISFIFVFIMALFDQMKK